MKSFILSLIVAFGALFVLQSHNTSKVVLSPTDSMTILSYNVENLFDTIDDVSTRDEEFTPQGAKRWDSYRYHKKLDRIAYLISHAGGRQWPSLVALIEVENAGVMNDLLRRTCLGERGYRYVITHSLDLRGIDVALLYRDKDIVLISSREHLVTFPTDSTRRSRNVLECLFRLPNGDEMFTLVGHWPSRREGVQETEPFRFEVAKLMRKRCDEYYEALNSEKRSRTHFLLMGDFNEEANELSMVKGLNSLECMPNPNAELSDTLQLVSLMSHKIEVDAKSRSPRGSYCYKRVWSQLDHFVMSESLFKASSQTRYIPGSAMNYSPRFLQDTKYEVAGYSTPRRTYGGDYYLGGYSDHYPIVMKLSL